MCKLFTLDSTRDIYDRQCKLLAWEFFEWPHMTLGKSSRWIRQSLNKILLMFSIQFSNILLAWIVVFNWRKEELWPYQAQNRKGYFIVVNGRLLASELISWSCMIIGFYVSVQKLGLVFPKDMFELSKFNGTLFAINTLVVGWNNITSIHIY